MLQQDTRDETLGKIKVSSLVFDRGMIYNYYQIQLVTRNNDCIVLHLYL